MAAHGGYTPPPHSRAGAVVRSIRSAVAVPKWALDFYLRHIRLVAGISTVPAAHRFTYILFDPTLPDPVDLLLEILVAGTRMLLLALIVRLAISRDARINRVEPRDQWERIEYFARFRWPSLIVQLILIAGAILLFNVFLEQIVPRWLPSDVERTYTAVLLALKNFTVIAWMMIWMVGIVRQMMLYSPAESKGVNSVSLSSSDGV